MGLLCVAWGNNLRVALNLLVLSGGVEKLSCYGLFGEYIFCIE